MRRREESVQKDVPLPRKLSESTKANTQRQVGRTENEKEHATSRFFSRLLETSFSFTGKDVADALDRLFGGVPCLGLSPASPSRMCYQRVAARCTPQGHRVWVARAARGHQRLDRSTKNQCRPHGSLGQLILSEPANGGGGKPAFALPDRSLELSKNAGNLRKARI